MSWSHGHCYRSAVARPKRSISLPAELDAAIEDAATLQGISFSGWLAQTAAHRLRLDAGWLGIEEWEADNGRLTAEELAEGRRRAKEGIDAAAAAFDPVRHAAYLKRLKEAAG